jgi:hypothetical protein
MHGLGLESSTTSPASCTTSPGFTLVDRQTSARTCPGVLDDMIHTSASDAWKREFIQKYALDFDITRKATLPRSRDRAGAESTSILILLPGDSGGVWAVYQEGTEAREGYLHQGGSGRVPALYQKGAEA